MAVPKQLSYHHQAHNPPDLNSPDLSSPDLKPPDLKPPASPAACEAPAFMPLPWLRRLIFSMALETLMLMAIGSATRVMNAGLACPDWPLCYGELVPMQQMNFQVFLEWFHRLMASLMGCSAIALWGLSFWYRRRLPSWLPLASGFALFLIVFQGILGGLTVTQLLRFDIVTAHLATALLFFLTLVTMGCWLIPETAAAAPVPSVAPRTAPSVAPIAADRGNSSSNPSPQTQKTSPELSSRLSWGYLPVLGAIATLLVYGQSLLGALVGSQWAVHQCLGQSQLCGVMHNHLLGVVPASLACLAVLGGSWRGLRRSPALTALQLRLRSLSYGILGCLVLQIGLGFATLYFRLQVQPLTVAHQFVGASLLGCLMAFTVLAWRAKRFSSTVDCDSEQAELPDLGLPA